MSSLLRRRIKRMLPRSLLVQQLDQGTSNCVLLTFDDGPHPEFTPSVLARLEAYKTRAVFFVIGRRIEKAPYLLRQIQERGHEIGNHTYTHPNSRQPWFLPYWQDLLRCQSIIEKQTGKRPKLFRPPGGRISLTSLLAPRLLGLRTVTWSLGVNDWRCHTTYEARQAARKILNKITAGDIILLHDDNPYGLEILDIILPEIRKREYDLFSGGSFL